MTPGGSTISVIIANYNYGHFLSEAVESVLSQTRLPEELLIIDDASSDNSAEIAQRYQDVARVVLNEQNLGIVMNFRKAVELTSGEYVVILGADNRMRSDFIERAQSVLDATPEAALAYSDMSIFGPRAHILAAKVGAKRAAAGDVFVWEFPDSTPEQLQALQEGRNFIHGSAVYRRSDYVRAGGYLASDGPEDRDLWARMLTSSRQAVRIAEPLIEYRQHSDLQANTVLSLRLEAAEARERIELLEQRVLQLHEANERSKRLLERRFIRGAYWRLRRKVLRRYPAVRTVGRLITKPLRRG